MKTYPSNPKAASTEAERSSPFTSDSYLITTCNYHINTRPINHHSTQHTTLLPVSGALARGGRYSTVLLILNNNSTSCYLLLSLPPFFCTSTRRTTKQKILQPFERRKENSNPPRLRGFSRAEFPLQNVGSRKLISVRKIHKCRLTRAFPDIFQ